MDISAVASAVSALVLSPKLIRLPASTDACSASQPSKPAPPPAISSPSPTAGLSTLSASSYDLGHDIGVGVGAPSRQVYKKGLRDWLGGMQEVWDVLRGCAPTGVAHSREEGCIDGGAQGSSGFVVVKDRSPVSNPGLHMDAHEPRVELRVEQGNVGASRVVTLIVPHDLSWQVRECRMICRGMSLRVPHGESVLLRESSIKLRESCVRLMANMAYEDHIAGLAQVTDWCKKCFCCLCKKKENCAHSVTTPLIEGKRSPRTEDPRTRSTGEKEQIKYMRSGRVVEGLLILISRVCRGSKNIRCEWPHKSMINVWWMRMIPPVASVYLLLEIP
eukprot:scaffold67227_cov18-Tisochrysis_lutea.AAC.2